MHRFLSWTEPDRATTPRSRPWGREINKMIGWGAEVPAAEKDAFINYLTTLFNPSRPAFSNQRP
jgi:hypothetical protein